MITKQEFARRRHNLMQTMEQGSIAIVASSQELVRSRDTHFMFRQDSDFHYLCGFPEPNAVLALIPGREHGEFVLFCNDKDPQQETWHGRRIGPEAACEKYGADDAFPIDDIDQIIDAYNIKELYSHGQMTNKKPKLVTHNYVYGRM